MSEAEVRAALRNLIRGAGVRRGSHSLVLEEQDVTALFLETLNEEGFHRMRVEEVPIEPGQRAPAFYVREKMAHFGWVFWEAFFVDRMRKIFGSIDRNEKGDWSIMLGRKDEIYTNPSFAEEMDLEHPSEF